MPFSFSLEGYKRYRERVGEATYIDLTRRADPACSDKGWQALAQIFSHCGAPWVLQLWTKDPAGVLRRGRTLLEQLRLAGATITAQVTITGLAGTPWEPLAPADAVVHLPELASVIGGADHICWRYDPIIPTVHHQAVFERLASAVCAQGVTRGVINFIAPPGRYRRVDARLTGLLPGWDEGMASYDNAWRAQAATELVQIARTLGFRLACCAESAGLADLVPGLGHAACGDAAWFAELSGRAFVRPGKGSRTGCGCAPYYDIGSYGLWTHCHRCVYCYAG